MSTTNPIRYTVSNTIAANAPMTPASIARAISRARGSARGVSAAIKDMVAAGEIVMVDGRCHTPATRPAPAVHPVYRQSHVVDAAARAVAEAYTSESDLSVIMDRVRALAAAVRKADGAA